MAILIFGKSGQVAQELARRVPGALCLGRDACDLAVPGAAVAAIASHAPEGVINAAAYTAVDAAETHEAEAFALNAQAPGAMAQACAARGIPFVHLSTDYVFDGQGEQPWQPDDPTGPLGVYGRSKLAGEDAARAAGGPHVILRTSWVFSAHGQNFLKTMLTLGQTRDHLTVVADQIGGPTAAGDIAEACVQALEILRKNHEKSGVYHYSGAPDTSWAGFARAIFKAAGLDVTVEDIPTSAWPTPAARPLNSRLNCTSLEAEFGLKRPDWARAVNEILKELT